MKALIKCSKKGSITVEACIAFPVFLCFFFSLLFFIKITCINIMVNHAVSETAKQLAASAYPVKYLNELEDDILLNDGETDIPEFSEEVETIKKEALNSLTGGFTDIIGGILSGDVTKDNIGKTIGEIADSFKNDIVDRLAGDYSKGLGAYLGRQYAGKYYEVKAKAKYAAAKSLMERFLTGNFIDRNRLSYTFVELPQSYIEQKMKSEDSAYTSICDKLGYTPEKDDVVVAVEYVTDIPLPFLGKKSIVLKHMAVEKAWIKGSNGVYSLDGLNDASGENDGSGSGDADTERKIEESYEKVNEETVYITKTGTKYHKRGCMYLARSCIPIKLADARAKHYEECKVCFKGFNIGDYKRQPKDQK